MLGKFLRHELRQLLEHGLARPLGLHHVHEAAELGGEVGGLRRRIGTGGRGMRPEESCAVRVATLRARPLQHEHRQHQEALDLADGGRKIEDVGVGGRGLG